MPSAPTASDSQSPAFTAAGKEEDDSEVEDANDNIIEHSILLDIAFLHSIATHRPIGLHKHFNMIPILLKLDRTCRQVGARIRDDFYQEEEASAAEAEAGDTSIKREEGVEDLVADDSRGLSSASPASLPNLIVDSESIWKRLNQLYDVEGLEDLENQAIDIDADTPFRNALFCERRRSLHSLQQIPRAYGFGSGLQKKKRPTKPWRSSSKKVDDGEDGKDSGTDDVEFELGPWDEYESLIAPRRLKSYAAGDDEPAESDDEELSEPSEAGARGEAASDEEATGGEEDAEEGSETEAEAEDDEDEDEDEEGANEEDGEQEEEEEQEGEEEEEHQGIKRKSTSSAKKSGGSGPSSSKRSKQTTAGTASSSRGTRNSMKPRRSTRR